MSNYGKRMVRESKIKEIGQGAEYTAGTGIDITEDVISADIDNQTIIEDSVTGKIKTSIGGSYNVYSADVTVTNYTYINGFNHWLPNTYSTALAELNKHWAPTTTEVEITLSANNDTFIGQGSIQFSKNGYELKFDVSYNGDTYRVYVDTSDEYAGLMRFKLKEGVEAVGDFIKVFDSIESLEINATVNEVNPIVGQVIPIDGSSIKLNGQNKLYAVPSGIAKYGLKIADLITYYHDGRTDVRMFSQEELIAAGMPILSTTESESSSYVYKDNVINIPKGQGNQVAVHDLFALAGQDGNLRIYVTTTNKTGTAGDELVVFRNGGRAYMAFETRFRDAYNTYGDTHYEYTEVEATADNYIDYYIYVAEDQEYVLVSNFDPVPAFDPNETYYDRTEVIDWSPYIIYVLNATNEGNTGISSETAASPVNLTQPFIKVSNPLGNVRYGNQLEVPAVDGTYNLKVEVSAGAPTFSWATPSVGTSIYAHTANFVLNDGSSGDSYTVTMQFNYGTQTGLDAVAFEGLFDSNTGEFAYPYTAYFVDGQSSPLYPCRLTFGGTLFVLQPFANPDHSGPIIDLDIDTVGFNDVGIAY